MEPTKDYNLIVGIRIREIRESSYLTRFEFSEKCDLSESFLAAVENGKKAITSKTLYKICTSMNISADYIIRGFDNGFETDSAMELLETLDKDSKKAAVNILREYCTAIIKLKSKIQKK